MEISVDIKKYFTLGRKFDLKLRHNQFAIGFALFTFLFYYLYAAFFVTSSAVSIDNIRIALDAGLLSLLTWIVAREFDPEEPLTAIVAQVLTSVVIILLPPEFDILLIPLLLVVLSSRIVNRTTGNELVLGDYIVITGIGVGFSLLTGNWLYALIAAFAMIFDSLFNEKPKLDYIFAVISVITSIFLMYTEGVFRYVVYLAPLFEYFFLLMLVLTIIVRFVVRRDVDSINDRGSKLDKNRVMAGSLLIIISFLGMTFFAGEFGYATAIPFWSITLVYPFIGAFNRD